jgi:hypothetical protein
MKKAIVILLITVFCTQCSAQDPSSIWQVKDMKTTYTPKGVSDRYELPLDLKGKEIKFQYNLLTLTEIRKNYIGSALNDEFGDTIILEKKVLFKRQDDDDISKMYPGDEFIECVQNYNDTCFASESFFNLLGFKDDVINAYISPVGKHSKTKLILFVLRENREMVLYSENDFLLLFLSKNK